MLPYRVLDLTDERGQLCGQILANLGCDVVLVEPPGGSHSRQVGPFAGDVVGPERSLVHWSQNRGKRSVVLDLDSPADRDRFCALAADADVVVESFDPGHLDALGLGAERLAETNPALVHVSITAFGSDGPKANWAYSDLTLAAAAGPMSLTGDDDRSPLRISLPQTFLHAAADAAGGRSSRSSSATTTPAWANTSTSPPSSPTASPASPTCWLHRPGPGRRAGWLVGFASAGSTPRCSCCGRARTARCR